MTAPSRAIAPADVGLTADLVAKIAAQDTALASAQAAATQAQTAAANAGHANVRAVLLSNLPGADRTGNTTSTAALADAKTQAAVYPGAPIELEGGRFKVLVGSPASQLGPYTKIRDGSLVATGVPTFTVASGPNQGQARDPFDTTAPGYDPNTDYVSFITTPDNPDGLQTTQKSVMEHVVIDGGVADPSKSNLIVRDTQNNAAVDNSSNAVQGGRIAYRFRGMQFFREEALKAAFAGVGVLGYPLKAAGGSNSGRFPSLHIAECNVAFALIVPKNMDYPPGCVDIVIDQLEALGSKQAGFAVRGLTKNGVRLPGQLTINGGAPEHTDESESNAATYRIVPNPADRSEDLIVSRCSGFSENFDVTLNSYRNNEAELHFKVEGGVVTKSGASLVMGDEAKVVFRDGYGPGVGRFSEGPASAAIFIEGMVNITTEADCIASYRGRNTSVRTVVGHFEN